VGEGRNDPSSRAVHQSKKAATHKRKESTNDGDKVLLVAVYTILEQYKALLVLQYLVCIEPTRGPWRGSGERTRKRTMSAAKGVCSVA